MKTSSWFWLHKWSSLICTVFLLILCLTGLPLIFEDDIDAFFDTHPPLPEVAAYVPHATLDQAVDAARQRYPGEVIRFMIWDREEPRKLGINMSTSASAPAAKGRVVTVDTFTARIIDEAPPQDGFMHLVLQLHQNLFLGLAGDIVIGVMGLLLIVALFSGAVLYDPFMRRLEFGTVRRDRSTRLRWLDLHNLLGIATLVWLTVVGATGVINTLSRPLFSLWSAQELPRLKATGAAPSSPTGLASIETVVGQARKALPGKRISSVVFPNATFGSAQHYLLWTYGDTPLTSRMYTPALMDAHTGDVVFASTLPWYLKILEISRPLHFGDYGGWPLKILWALLDLIAIVVLGSGLYLWIARHQASRARLERFTRTHTKDPTTGNGH